MQIDTALELGASLAASSKYIVLVPREHVQHISEKSARIPKGTLQTKRHTIFDTDLVEVVREMGGRCMAAAAEDG